MITCLNCREENRPGAFYCKNCGEPLACPRCHAELISVMVGDAVLDECTRCGGEWLDQETD